MTRSHLHARIWDNLWVAALLAILFKVLAMPMAGTLGELSLTQLLAGGYCSPNGGQLVVVDKGGTDSPQVSDPGHCCCSQGGPVPLPVTLVLPRVLPEVLPVDALVVRVRSPRHCWPSINPRASPVSIA
ncbi:DUF2946 family protein [Pseudomonas cichorii]|nr:DUF2946 family protein [Pseudomonas cichorii]MBX8534761.1 DUF2946 family protein [Pseudomonas cichorii]